MQAVTVPAAKSDQAFTDPLRVVRNGVECDALRNLISGPAFLACGGPSAKSLPLEQLERRGVFSMAVNNMAGYVRTSAFVCADPPQKFHHGIWLDPAIIKFIPTAKALKNRWNLRMKDERGLSPLKIDGRDMRTIDCPNVWAFERRSWMRPDDSFFTEISAAWGNHKDGAKANGQPTTVCTMLLGMRLLYWLGARTIYLVGVDFHMDPIRDLHGNYAFGQERNPEAVNTNNGQYRIVNNWLCLMRDRGVFDRFGLKVFNCNPNSALHAFEHVSFQDALQDARRNFPAEPFDLTGWYAT